MNNCCYCDRLTDRTEVILENDLCVFLQIQESVLIGSGLIIPRTHRETVFDLTSSEWSALYDIIHQAKTMLDQTYQPDGYNLGWNCGAIGGQHVFHAHIFTSSRAIKTNLMRAKEFVIG
jgi:histidine triad (HIT) family protein